MRVWLACAATVWPADRRGVTSIEYAVLAAIVVTAALLCAQIIAENVIMRAGRILASL
jgi:Flp pilus assembly pilin Flp